MRPLRKDILALKKLGFSIEEILAMSRGEVRGYDKAYTELMTPEKSGGTKVNRKKKAKAKG